VIEVKLFDQIQKKRVRKTKKRKIEDVEGENKKQKKVEILAIEEGVESVVPPPVQQKEKEAKKKRIPVEKKDEPVLQPIESLSVPVAKKTKPLLTQNHSDHHQRFEEPLESDSGTESINTTPAPTPVPTPIKEKNKNTFILPSKPGSSLPSNSRHSSASQPPPPPTPPPTPTPYTQRNEVRRRIPSSSLLSLFSPLRLQMLIPSRLHSQPPPPRPDRSVLSGG
jgi:hypothetical protein